MDELPPEVVEVHMVGGCTPEMTVEGYCALFSAAKSSRPGVTVKGMTAVEVDHLARTEGMEHRDVLESFMAAGLEFLAGGGAEILDDDIRAVISPDKCDSETWISVHREAHLLGMRSNATILVGHIEEYPQRVDHLMRIRKLQDETGGFMALVPLIFIPDRSKLSSRTGAPVTRMNPEEVLRFMAIARLTLDNVPHIKAYWPTMGWELAELALHYGADDLDGTLSRERIMAAAGSNAGIQATREHLISVIENAGMTPVDRTAFYERV